MKNRISHFWFVVLVILGSENYSALSAQSGKLVLIAGAEGDLISQISPEKVKVALTTAIELTSGKVDYLHPRVQDSIANSLSTPSAVEVATRAKCDQMIFVWCRRFAGLIRVEVVSVFGENFTKRKNGIGYSMIRYYDKDQVEYIDPSVLEATQRALCVALQDSTLYGELSSENLRVQPGSLIVASCFVIDGQNLPEEWTQIGTPLITSFDVLQTVINEGNKSLSAVICDLSTRDSMYRTAGMVMPENHNPTSNLELKILRKFGIDQVIYGRLIYDEETKTANITLHLTKITDQATLYHLDEFVGQLKSDSVEELRTVIRLGTRKLLNL